MEKNLEKRRMPKVWKMERIRFGSFSVFIYKVKIIFYVFVVLLVDLFYNKIN